MHPRSVTQFIATCSDHSNLLKETLEKQFELVKERTSRNGSYIQGSHVLQFGSLDIDEEAASDYLGEANTGVISDSAYNAVLMHGGFDVSVLAVDVLIAVALCCQ